MIISIMFIIIHITFLFVYVRARQRVNDILRWCLYFWVKVILLTLHSINCGISNNMLCCANWYHMNELRQQAQLNIQKKCWTTSGILNRKRSCNKMNQGNESRKTNVRWEFRCLAAICSSRRLFHSNWTLFDICFPLIRSFITALDWNIDFHIRVYEPSKQKYVEKSVSVSVQDTVDPTAYLLQ